MQYAKFLSFQLSILGSSVVGSYVMLLFYDDFIGTRLAYIILNIVKRAVSENLEFATNDLPFEIKGIYQSWEFQFINCQSFIPLPNLFYIHHNQNCTTSNHAFF